MRNNLKIVFFGTPEFAVASLDKLITNGYDIAAVVTMPDKRGGRGHGIIESDVKKYAAAHNLKIMQPERLRNEEFISSLKSLEADLFVVIAFRMLPECIWNMPPLGTINLHASLLPRYRGAAPINHAVMNGDTTTGVTTFFLKHDIDTGDIIGSKEISIGPDENVGSVHDRLMTVGADLIVETVNDIAAGNVKTIPQPEGDFIPAPKIFREQCKIDWSQSAQQIHNQIRGLSPYPAAWCTMEDCCGKELEIKIMEARIADKSKGCKAGCVIADKSSLLIETSDGVIEIVNLRPAGKRLMTSSEFLRGYKPVRFK